MTAPDLRLRAAAAGRLLPHSAVVADRCLLWLLGVGVLPPGLPVLEVVVPRGAVVRHVVPARRALELSDPRSESPPESRLRFALVAAGLAPVPQYEVRDVHGRFLARVDPALPDLRLAIEPDGRAVHDRADAFVVDRRRQNALVAAGWTVLRFTGPTCAGGPSRPSRRSSP